MLGATSQSTFDVAGATDLCATATGVAAIAGACLLGGLIMIALADHQRASNGPVSGVQAPLDVMPLRHSHHTGSDNGRRLARLRWPSGVNDNLPQCLHILRMRGILAQASGRADDGVLRNLSDLFDEQRAAVRFGRAPFVRTRTGVRSVTSDVLPLNHDRSNESHRDQTLATLAELYVPPSQPITLRDGVATLGDVIADSVANFHLKQRELAWTAIAYAHYLPPVSRWKNRYGESFSFDDVAKALFSRPVNREPCCGTHNIMAAMTLTRVDDVCPILSAAARQALDTQFRTVVVAILSAQKSDGTWLPNWYDATTLPIDQRKERPEVFTDPNDLLLATSHLAECLLYSPYEPVPLEPALDRAVPWLKHRLDAASDTEIEANFCPYSHAALAVALYEPTVTKDIGP